MDSLMDNCSFLKKDLDAAKLHGHLYVFKYLIMRSGEPVRTDKVCVRGKDRDEAEKKAREILTREYGIRVNTKITKCIELES